MRCLWAIVRCARILMIVASSVPARKNIIQNLLNLTNINLKYLKLYGFLFLELNFRAMVRPKSLGPRIRQQHCNPGDDPNTHRCLLALTQKPAICKGAKTRVRGRWLCLQPLTASTFHMINVRIVKSECLLGWTSLSCTYLPTWCATHNEISVLLLPAWAKSRFIFPLLQEGRGSFTTQCVDVKYKDALSRTTRAVSNTEFSSPTLLERRREVWESYNYIFPPWGPSLNDTVKYIFG